MLNFSERGSGPNRTQSAQAHQTSDLSRSRY